MGCCSWAGSTRTRGRTAPSRRRAAPAGDWRWPGRCSRKARSSSQARWSRTSMTTTCGTWDRSVPMTNARLLVRAGGLLMPIEWAEPFGLVMIEALATGTPVIAFDRGAAAEIVVDGENGFLVSDVDGMVAAIDRLHEIDPHHCRRSVQPSTSPPSAPPTRMSTPTPSRAPPRRPTSQLDEGTSRPDLKPAKHVLSEAGRSPGEPMEGMGTHKAATSAPSPSPSADVQYPAGRSSSSCSRRSSSWA